MKNNLTLTEKIEELIKQLQQNIYEKEVIFRLTMLAMLSGESIFLLGKPGIAKSLVARRLKHSFNNGIIFEYLINPLSTPEEIFGPISIENLQKGSYCRLIDKYLPTAEIVFLDEIWKVGLSIKNTLLTIINEKIFRNSGFDIKIPMKLLISASNELPIEGQGLEALFDCFIIRYIVQGVKTEENFNYMISGVTELDVKIDKNLKITHEEYNIWRKKINQIKINQNTFDFINSFRKTMYIHTEGKYYISDRRWKKIAHLMKSSAFYNGRSEVDKPDWLIIPHCIWNNEEQEIEYNLVFNKLYLDVLTYDVRQKKIILNQELEQLAYEYDNLQEIILNKSEYYNIFDGKVKGSFYRIFWNNLQYPVCFIRTEYFDKIRLNNKELTKIQLFYGKDLDNMVDIMEANVSFVNDKIIHNFLTNEDMMVEIKNDYGDKPLKNLEIKILKIEKEINKLETAFEDEKKYLLSLPCIFFKDKYYLAINNSFNKQELKFDEFKTK